MGTPDFYAPLTVVEFLPLRVHQDDRRRLAAVTNGQEIPFAIVQVFTISGAVPDRPLGGGHAHRELQQCLIPVVGTTTLSLWDGRHTATVELSDPRQALCIPPMVWVDFTAMSAGAVCLVLSSGPHREREYIRTRAELSQWVVDQGPYYMGALRGQSPVSRC